MEFATWWRTKDWKPVVDTFLAITRDGRISEIALLRGVKPKIAVRPIYDTTMRDVVALTRERGSWGMTATPWVVRSADGTMRRYIDPVYTDHSFKGVEVENLPRTPGVALF